jgi:hypothetical protein
VILIQRGPEPDALRKVRRKELRRLVKVAKANHPHHPDGDAVGNKYKVVAEDLWRAQRHKCAFCEIKLTRGHNDVEHRRPKGRADRRPGSTETHGYWWLAFTWENLVFCCPPCNRSYKRTLFPLDAGSVALAAHERPPGREIALLLDPAEETGVKHIEFVFTEITPAPVAGTRAQGWPLRKHWHPRARGGSAVGEKTIEVCGLDDADLVELYDAHVQQEVRRFADDLNAALKKGEGVSGAFARAEALLSPWSMFVGLSYDALVALVDAALLKQHGLAWPAPDRVGLAPPRRGR